ncbi:CRISPR-associated endonuclease Cas2 [Streptomyces sp900105755]|uniref:CRISPR-associated endoribonuclease Cas2 n=1 Tax=Streptomyces sp. 900105755 TaxID=3154389 RepID=A0ABV1TWN4_9ACTN
MVPRRPRYFFLVAYDIADNNRREEVSDLLSGHGPRVQYSVFEVALPSKAATARLRAALKKLIDPEEDQIRLYPLSAPGLNEITILGNRRLEERADFWIV